MSNLEEGKDSPEKDLRTCVSEDTFMSQNSDVEIDEPTVDENNGERHLRARGGKREVGGSLQVWGKFAISREFPNSTSSP